MPPITDIVDAFSTEQYQNDPHSYLEHLRETDPVHRSRRSGFVYITRHVDSAKLLRSPKFGRDLRHWNSPYNTYRAENARRDPTAAILSAALEPWMLNNNPPDHTRIRKVFAHAFVPAAVGQMEDAVAHETSRSLAALPAHGGVELISAFALPLPGRIVGRIFDVPERDSDQLAAWSQAIMLSQSPVASLGVKYAAKRALEAFQRYMAEFVAQRRAKPGEGLIDRVIAAERIEGAISEQELVVNILGILLAGHETSSALIGNGLLTLLQHPAQLERLRADSSLMPGAIEEVLRFEPPSTTTPRVALEPNELSGVPIAAGELCWTVHAAVNRDPEVFTQPQVFDLSRSPNPHQSFGGGIHHCIGASLARLTVKSALQQLLARYPQISLAEARPTWRASVSTRALAQLSLLVGE